jgi:hypothetical protein
VDSHLKIGSGFDQAFGRRPLALEHGLAEHELLTVDALADLAGSLPSDKVEHNVGNLPEVVEGGDVAQSELPPAEIARTIETNGQWMVLKNIETDPRYNALLDAALDEVEPHVSSEEGGMLQREGFIFLSAPNSVTPSHTDPEHNILLQIRGRKEMNVGAFPDERTKQLELESYAMGGHRNVAWKPVEPQLFDMHPGDAVYVPPHAPHWVNNGEQASISLSVTFRTPATVRSAQVSSINARLRKLGLSPQPPGKRPGVDSAKAALSGTIGRIRGG